MNFSILRSLLFNYSLSYWLLLLVVSASTVRALPLAQLPTAGRAITKATSRTSSGVLVVVRGNSQAYGALTTGNSSAIGSGTDGAWPDQAAALLGSGYTWQNRSHNGATIDYLRRSDDVEVAPLFGTGQYEQEWIVLQETTNQIFQANPAQQVYDKMVAWAQYWKAKGVKVAVVTCYATQDPQYNPEIDDINALYRANWATFCDMLLDVRSSPYITQYGMNPQYGYAADDLHLNDIGNQIPAHCVADGFASALRTGIEPATFLLPGIPPPTPLAPLPVKLVTFTALYDANSVAVHLNWATASENASARFDVERSTDGIAFALIGTLPAVGNSSTRRTYQLSDAHLPAGVRIFYYRLRQVDIDGTSSYSVVRSISLVALCGGLVLFPNPARTMSILKNAEPGAVIQLLDALGRLVATTTANSTGTAEFILPPGLLSGLYMVRTGSQFSQLIVQQ